MWERSHVAGTVDWNVTTESGEPVASGIYLIIVDYNDSNGRQKLKQKIVVVK